MFRNLTAKLIQNDSNCGVTRPCSRAFLASPHVLPAPPPRLKCPTAEAAGRTPLSPLARTRSPPSLAACPELAQTRNKTILVTWTSERGARTVVLVAVVVKTEVVNAAQGLFSPHAIRVSSTVSIPRLLIVAGIAQRHGCLQGGSNDTCCVRPLRSPGTCLQQPPPRPPCR